MVPGDLRENLPAPAGRAREVLTAFLKLGVLSFGGPVAHIGYFHAEFVDRRRWLDDESFTDLVALCQFLPGPASSQLGFSLGLMRAGYLGGLAAWTGFTLPSAILMVLAARVAKIAIGPSALGVIHGLKLVAVCIVAQAVWAMARTLCPDWQRACLALAAGVILLLTDSNTAPLAVLTASGIAGYWLCRTSPAAPRARELQVAGVSRRVGIGALLVFGGLLLALPLFHGWPAAARFDAYYRSGALVFGGGHVVLPLLHRAFVDSGWVRNDLFLAGYGAAQAVPGPLFTFAAYLGAITAGVPGAAVGLLGIFLPGLLIVMGALPYWQLLRVRTDVAATVRGINAAVVGLLGAALYDPIGRVSVHSGLDMGLVVIGFGLLTVGRAPPLLIVVLGALAGALIKAP